MGAAWKETRRINQLQGKALGKAASPGIVAFAAEENIFIFRKVLSVWKLSERPVSS
jgi:hypothetical protein